MRSVLVFLLLAVAAAAAQIEGTSNSINISGDAEVKVVPDRVSILLGVESRSKTLDAATEQTDAAIRQVMATARKFGVDATDIQTDYIHVDLSYNDK